MHIIKSKINKLNLSSEYDPMIIEIGIPVLSNEKDIIGLRNIGDTVLPSKDFGKVCKENAYGHNEVDKSKPKARRYITTNYIYPFGNKNAHKVACDVYRKCWQKKIVPPMGIELSLVNGSDNKEYIVANLTNNIRKNYLKETINIFLEIYKNCYIFKNDLKIDTTIRKKCNWEILPKGQRPSLHLTNILRKQNRDPLTFDVARLTFLEKYKISEIIEGINGFNGYYAYLFDKYCFLESAFYGNATYVIQKENWEILSQKTKGELLDANEVVEKINHTEKWFDNMKKLINTLEGQ